MKLSVPTHSTELTFPFLVSIPKYLMFRVKLNLKEIRVGKESKIHTNVYR